MTSARRGQQGPTHHHAASDALIREGYMLREDLAWVVARAKAHWAFSVNGAP